MDLYCPKCAEPHALDALRDEAQVNGRSFDAVRADFYRRGCEALSGLHNDPVDSELREGISLIYELLGDDVDGAAAELEDFMAMIGDEAL